MGPTRSVAAVDRVEIALDRGGDGFPHRDSDDEHDRDREEVSGNPPAEIGAEPAEGSDIPRLEHGQRGQDVNCAADQSGQDWKIAVGALLERRELRLELRRNGKTPPAQLTDRADDQLCREDDDEAQSRSARDVNKPALDTQRVNQVEAANVEDCEGRPDLGETAADAAPTGRGTGTTSTR